MAEVIIPNAVVREKDFLYFIDGKGNVCKIIRETKVEEGKERGQPTIILKNAVKRERDFLYFIDGKGNVCKTKMDRYKRPKEEIIEDLMNLEEEKWTEFSFLFQDIQDLFLDLFSKSFAFGYNFGKKGTDFKLDNSKENKFAEELLKEGNRKLKLEEESKENERRK